MDFSLREWLLVIGAVLIVGVLIDGYRRARTRKRGSLKLAIDKNLKFRDEDRIDYFHGELPSGSVRVVRRSGAEAADSDGEATEEAGSDQDIDEPVFSPEDRELRPDPLFVDDSERVATSDVDAALAEDEPAASTGEEIEPAASARDEPEPAASTPDEPELAPSTPDEPEAKEPRPAAADREVEEVIVINAFSPEGTGFKGDELMGVILACGMRFGEMNIFHRAESEKANSPIQFSMANVVKPGYFELDEMEHFTTPGVSFFMSLPGPSHSMQAFDYMLETAQCLVKNLGGELRDEQHSTLTGQTIEHARQKIRDFERRQLSLLQ